MKRIIVIVLMLALILVDVPRSFSEPNKIIARYSGEESLNTTPFTTRERWVILYTAEGPIEIVLRKKDGTFYRTAIQDVEAGSKGSAVQEEPGTYYLDVDAYRLWHIQIREME